MGPVLVPISFVLELWFRLGQSVYSVHHIFNELTHLDVHPLYSITLISSTSYLFSGKHWMVPFNSYVTRV